MGEVLHGEPGVIPQEWDEALEVKKAKAHDKECEQAAMAYLKEQERFRSTSRRKFY